MVQLARSGALSCWIKDDVGPRPTAWLSYTVGVVLDPAAFAASHKRRQLLPPVTLVKRAW
jgi:hypothetical protein